MEVARGWERNDGELVFNGERVCLWNDEKFWKLVIGMVTLYWGCN